MRDRNARELLPLTRRTLIRPSRALRCTACAHLSAPQRRPDRACPLPIPCPLCRAYQSQVARAAATRIICIVELNS